MDTISIISQKGGAGKSTLTTHLAVEAVKNGIDTAIIDLDPQASTASWGDRREAELPIVISAQAKRLPHEMERVRDAGCGRLFIDTAPHSDSAALAAARVSDLVLVPCLPNIFDIEAVMTTVELLQAVKTPYFVVLNEVAPVGKGEANEAEEVLRQQGIPVCPARIAKRVAYARSLAFGEVAHEYELRTQPLQGAEDRSTIQAASKAVAEMERLNVFVSEHMNTLARERAHTPTKETNHAQ